MQVFIESEWIKETAQNTDGYTNKNACAKAEQSFIITLNGKVCKFNNSKKEREMKKCFLLTSILVLSACGGGSGGGGGGNVALMDLTLPDGVRSAVASDVQNSNSHVTSMKSEILVATKGGKAQVVRSSVPLTNASGVTFISYDLSDVKLRPADKNIPENAYLKIGVNGTTGAVEHMTMVMGIDPNTYEPIGGELARIADSAAGKARFKGPIFEYVADKYAKDGGQIYKVANNIDAMKADIVTKRGFGEGTWVEDTDGKAKYRLSSTDQFATYNDKDSNPVVLAIDNPDESAGYEAALKEAYNFADGKWETVNDYRQYREYGDSSEYRIADDGNVTKAQLDAIAARTDLNLSALGHWNRVDETMEVVSLGGGAGLQYSDFGHFNPVYSEKKIDLTTKESTAWNNVGETKTHTTQQMEDEFNGKDYQLFAGGYAINGTTLKNTLDAPTNATFTGNAIGRVYVSFQSNGVNRDGYLEDWDVPYDNNTNDGYTVDAGHDMAMDYTTTGATLTVDANGKQTLNMPFTDFYTVNVERSGNTDTVSFTDSGNVMVASQYRQNNEPDSAADVAFRPGYYGVGTASEAAGTLYYKTVQGIGTGGDAGKISREWEFQAAYGMKKDQ